MAELTRIQAVVALQSCDLFAYCKAEEILRIAGIARERSVSTGESIYRKNDPAEGLYAIVHGRVRLEGGDGGPQEVGPLQAFGVRDILCGRLREQSATAIDDTLVFVLETEDFFDLLSNNIDIVKALFRHLLGT